MVFVHLCRASARLQMINITSSSSSSTSSSSSPSSSILLSRNNNNKNNTNNRRRGTRGDRNMTMKVSASIDASIALAVAQQNLALALVLGSECLYNQQKMATDFVGYPSIKNIIPGVGGLVGAFVVISSDNAVGTPAGLVLGCLACLYIMKVEVDRLVATPSTELDWPGPKVFPGGLALFACLQFITNAQGFLREI